MELVSLNATHPDTRRTSPWKILSVVVHVLLLGALTYKVSSLGSAVPAHKKKIIALKIVPYAPGRSAVVPAPRPKPKLLPPKEPPKLVLMKQPPPPPPPPSGGDPTGEADVSVAMADFFPAPKPDLSVLPHGTHGDVVIDITIDEDGKVVETHVDQGLGHGVDEAVVAVVETWTFTPATKDGKPVASEQQLLFHFERA
jgi:protein TonB